MSYRATLWQGILSLLLVSVVPACGGRTEQSRDLEENGGLISSETNTAAPTVVGRTLEEPTPGETTLALPDPAPVCPDGSWSTSGLADDTCALWMSCNPGEYVAKDGSAASDRVCLPCPEGSFSNSKNSTECTPQTVCPQATVSGSNTTDVACIPLPMLASGSRFSCFVGTNSSAWCWGRNGAGQLGDGTTVDRNAPVQVDGLDDVAFITGGLSHACALQLDATVSCWGDNSEGQLATGNREDRLKPTLVVDSRNVRALTAGFFHTCALLFDGTVECWGKNTYGVLGSSTDEEYLMAPSPVEGLENVAQLSAGKYHNCALTHDHFVYCWGANYTGQLGVGNWDDSAVPVQVPLPSKAVAIDAGMGHSCAVLDDGTGMCWGRNDTRQLGGYAVGPQTNPGVVRGLTDAVAIAAGGFHSCALKEDETAACWGHNNDGAVGSGTSDYRFYEATPVINLTDAAALSSGHYHTCALLTNDDVRCWGGNAEGQLGDGTNTDRYTPVDVIGLSP